MTRFVLYVIALLTGGYSALTWSVAMIDRSAVAGLICALALIAAEAIRYCRPRPPSERPRVTTHNGHVRRINTRYDSFDPQWSITCPGSWTIPEFSWPDQDRRAVWPNEIGSPE
jgi:hypothetical protein